MLQKASFTRPELQVETEQRKNLEFISMDFLHIEQTANGSAMLVSLLADPAHIKARDLRL